MENIDQDLKDENLNMEDLLTSNEAIDNIKMFDSTV